MGDSSTLDPSWYVTPEEIAALTENLRRSHHTLLTAVDSLSPGDWERAGSDAGWSAGQVVEHIFLAQRVLREQIRSHLQDAARPELLSIMEQQQARLFRYLPGGGKAQAGGQSTSFQGLDVKHVPSRILAAEEHFSELLIFASTYPVKVVAWSSPFFGELSAFLWLQYPALHTTRHVGQLQRLKASLTRSWGSASAKI